MSNRAILPLTLALFRFDKLTAGSGRERGHGSNRKEILRAVLGSLRTIALVARSMSAIVATLPRAASLA